MDLIGSTSQPRLPVHIQKVVVVNDNTAMLGLIESILDCGYYDMVFVESSEHAYSQIKRVQPDLVVLCVSLDDRDGLQVLSMLKLDGDTWRIPVVTYAAEFDGELANERTTEITEPDLFAPRPSVTMN